MVRSISDALKEHLAGGTTTLATCWLITRRDGRVMGFTDHDQDITIGQQVAALTFDNSKITFDTTQYKFDGSGGNGIIYRAASAFTPSTVQSNSNMAVDNLEVDGILDSREITDVDLLNGLYDFAAVQIFIINYTDLSQGALVLRTGYLGEVTVNKQMFTAEIRGIAQQLQENIGRIYSPTCDANLGDARCTVNLDNFTFTSEVSTAIDNQSFEAITLGEGVNYFTGGLVTWTSGQNNGLQMEIKEFAGTQVVLVLSMPNPISAGDFFEIVAGCDKTVNTCINTFDNILNFRAFPAIPGMNALFQTSGTFQDTLK